MPLHPPVEDWSDIVGDAVVDVPGCLVDVHPRQATCVPACRQVVEHRSESGFDMPEVAQLASHRLLQRIWWMRVVVAA